MFEWLKRLQGIREPFIVVRLAFGRYICWIRHESLFPANSEAFRVALIAMWVSYIARYFFICDEQQIKPLKAYLSSALAESPRVDANGLPTTFFGASHAEDPFFQALYGTLTEPQRHAARSVFPGAPLIPAGVAGAGVDPEIVKALIVHDLMEGTNGVKQGLQTVNYAFSVRIANYGMLANHLAMENQGALLAPAFGLAHTYFLAWALLRDTPSLAAELNAAGLRLLNTYDEIDCRSSKALTGAPDRALGPELLSLLH